ncbi:uncharacterized protein LOC124252889 [Haliotis rubra]|uniref:uncharacterized protein LOC124252889 n=1 Tax=Haliotis rubra TaxID=36100 RepID=UPI001EE556EA|nr:uncharacterized protein LOC124252889 [Haliotis rubra]
MASSLSTFTRVLPLPFVGRVPTAEGDQVVNEGLPLLHNQLPLPTSPPRRDLRSNDSMTLEGDLELPPPVVPIRKSPVGGRLGTYAPNWTIVGDPYVLSMLARDSSYQSSGILRSLCSRLATYPEQQLAVLQSTIDNLLKKLAIESLGPAPTDPGFYSPNLSGAQEGFGQTEPGDFMVSLDLQDAYIHIPIFPAHRKFIRFIFKGILFQWRVLPFGISSAPWLFTQITKSVTSFLHRKRIVFEAYIDDCIQPQNDHALLLRHMQFAIQFLPQLGWLINLQKSELVPMRRLQFIGAVFDTEVNKLFVPSDRFCKIQRLVSPALAQPRTLRQWQELLGLLTSAQALTLHPVQLFLALYIRVGDPVPLIPLPLELHPHLQWWMEELNVCDGVCLEPFVPSHHLYVDASQHKWGAHLLNKQVAELWSIVDRTCHINILEFRAVILAISHWQNALRASSLMIRSDNAAVVWHINRILVDSLNIMMTSPTVDLFATRFNHQLPQFVSPIPDPLAWDLDALAIPWEDLNAYAFPPVALLPLILVKLRATQRMTLLLVVPYWQARTKPHETRALASTMALHRNCSLQSIMEGCFWRSDTVFASDYLWDLSVTYVEGLHEFGPLVLAQQLSLARAHR